MTTTSTPDSTAAATAVPLRRNRDFTLLMSGATISQIGSGMSSLVFLMLAFQLTGSSARAGFAEACVGLGSFLVLLPAGALVDRWNRRTVMILTPLAGALVFATIPLAALLGHLTYPHVLAVAFCEGCLVFYGPAERASLKQIVPPEQMGEAASITMARSSLGSLVGPPMAGAVYAVSRTLPMLVDAVSFLAASTCAALVRTPLPAPERVEKPRLVADVREGFAFLWRVRAMRDTMLMALVVNLGLNGLTTVAILALQRDGIPATRLGLLESATGLAGIVGAVAAPAILRRLGVGRITAASMWLLLVLGLALTAERSLWAIGALLCVLVFGLMPLNSGISAYQLFVTPDELQGRAASASNFVAMAMVPLASAAAGVGLEHLGRTTTMLCFAAVLAVGAVGAVASRHIRDIPRVDQFTPGTEAA